MQRPLFPGSVLRPELFFAVAEQAALLLRPRKERDQQEEQEYGKKDDTFRLIPIWIQAETKAAARSRRRRTWRYVEESDAATTKVYT
jgi:hypothetical protein